MNDTYQVLQFVLLENQITSAQNCKIISVVVFKKIFIINLFPHNPLNFENSFERSLRILHDNFDHFKDIKGKLCNTQVHTHSNLNLKITYTSHYKH